MFLSVGFILHSTIADGYLQRHYDSREGLGRVGGRQGADLGGGVVGGG